MDNDRHEDPALLAADLRGRFEAQLAEQHFAGLLADLRDRRAPDAAQGRTGGLHAPRVRPRRRHPAGRALSPEHASKIT
jgi:hypothetical protein